MFAILGPVLMLTGRAVSGATYGAIVADVGGSTPAVLEAALIQIPAVWVVVGVTVALFGLIPAGLGELGSAGLESVARPTRPDTPVPAMVPEPVAVQPHPETARRRPRMSPLLILTAIAMVSPRLVWQVFIAGTSRLDPQTPDATTDRIVGGQELAADRSAYCARMRPATRHRHPDSAGLDLGRGRISAAGDLDRLASPPRTRPGCRQTHSRVCRLQLYARSPRGKGASS